MKNEPCPFERCRFSQQCNHIHCVRENCFYVLHSSGQLLSHKRKHERIDAEQAYRQFTSGKKVQIGSSSRCGSASDLIESQSDSPATPMSSGLMSIYGLNSAAMSSSNADSPDVSANAPSYPVQSNSSSPLLDYNKMLSSPNLPTDLTTIKAQSFAVTSSPASSASLGGNNSTLFLDSMQQYQKLLYGDRQVSIEKLMEFNEVFEQMCRTFCTSNCSRQTNGNENSPDKDGSEADSNRDSRTVKCTLPSSHVLAEQRHNHCLLTGCDAVLSSVPAEILEHLRQHQMVLRQKAGTDGSNAPMASTSNANEIVANDSKHMQITSIDGFFNRKRGRPPKNRVVEVYNNVSNLFIYSLLICP